MIDFIKIYVLDGVFIKDNPILEFTSEFSRKTGEVKRNTTKAIYKNLEFRAYDSGLLQITGSLHKFKNKGVHNYDFFSYEELKKVLDFIVEQFDLNPKECQIKQLEYGININSPINTNSILSSLKMHKRQPFCLVKYPNRYYLAEHSKAYIKAYNKGKQYKLKREVLRFEKKYTCSIELKNFRIDTISDLYDLDKLELLHNDLINAWDNCIIYQKPTHKVNFNHKKWSNTEYWLSLKDNCYRNKYSREVDKFKDYIKVHTTNLQLIIRDQFNQKWCKFHEKTNSKVVQISTSIRGEICTFFKYPNTLPNRNCNETIIIRIRPPPIQNKNIKKLLPTFTNNKKRTV